MKKKNEKRTQLPGKKITRKQAIKKVGVTALTTASLLFLETKASAQDSNGRPDGPPTRGGRR